MKGYQLAEALNKEANDVARKDRAKLMRDAAREIILLVDILTAVMNRYDTHILLGNYRPVHTLLACWQLTPPARRKANVKRYIQLRLTAKPKGKGNRASKRANRLYAPFSFSPGEYLPRLGTIELNNV